MSIFKTNSEEFQPWQTTLEFSKNGQVTKIKISKDGSILKFPQVFSLWKKSEAFQKFYNNILASSKYPGFFWEIKPMNQHWENEAFEFVLINSAALPKISANSQPFQKHFQTTDSIITFPNLGGDAQLIVPTPISDLANYPHFAQFVRNAPEIQKNKLWEIVSIEYQKRLNEKPQWLSTSGLGVYWLHLRIDSRPKYYHFQEYKIFE
ncbi:MAG: hypothetical protein AB8H03_13485 [Saprospiraceae bacterium]